MNDIALVAVARFGSTCEPDRALLVLSSRPEVQLTVRAEAVGRSR